MGMSIEWFRSGLRRLASDRGTSVAEATLFALDENLRVRGGDGIPDILASAQSLNPGDIYVQGLRGVSGVNDYLAGATRQVIGDLKAGSAEEHIPPVKNAFTWLTGGSLDSE